MSKLTDTGARHQKGCPSMRGLSPFDRIPRGSDGLHPVDIAVDKRIGDRVRRKWIVKLQNRIMAAMGGKSGLYLKLETMIIEQQRDRERCYFNIGYEHGAAETHAASGSKAAQAPRRAELFARALRERILQENIPANEATVALLQCALVLVESPRAG